MLEKLHYITQDGVNGFNHPQLAEKACQGGVKFVVLRAPKRSYASLKVIAMDTLAVCNKYGVKLIIASNALLAKEIGAFGVFLRRDDLPIDQVRMLCGDDFFIAAGANNATEIINADFLGANCIYLGPFSYNHTQCRYTEILGSAKVSRIIHEVRKEGVKLPLMAHGGVDIDDIPFLNSIGMDGFVVSTALNCGDLIENTSDFLEEIDLVH